MLSQGCDDERTTGTRVRSSVVGPLCFHLARARRRSSHVITRIYAPKFSEYDVLVTPLFTVMRGACACFPPLSPSCVALLIPMGMSSILHFLAPVVSEPVISGDATCSPVSAVDFVCKSPRQFQPVGHSWSIFLNGTMYATSSIYFKWLSSHSPIFKRTCHHLFLEAK